MDSFLRIAAGLVVIAVALGLVRIFRGSKDADRMMRSSCSAPAESR